MPLVLVCSHNFIRTGVMRIQRLAVTYESRGWELHQVYSDRMSGAK